ncbi:small multi-drug export protein [Candidatus Bipolaricaulota bacterium]|nr:small multi-drug export protein [Candidatus Bipolaricaulota bacterium]
MDWLAAGKVILLSAAPVAELRGGLPLALTHGFSPLLACLLAVGGNLLPVPFLLLGLDRLLRLVRALPGPLGRAARRYLAWQEARHRAWFRRLGEGMLVLLVAIPLPLTGAWTGSLAAVLLGIPTHRALPLISLGVLLAGGIVLLASLGLIAAL